MKCVLLSWLLGSPLFGCNSGLFRAPGFCLTCGKRRKKKEKGKEGKMNREGKEVNKEEGIKKDWRKEKKKEF